MLTIPNRSRGRRAMTKEKPASGVYLVTIATRFRRPIFTFRQPLLTGYASGRLVVEVLRDTQSAAITIAFVVMPDHLHWLLQVHPRFELSQIVEFVKHKTCRVFNLRYLHRGTLWQEGYGAQALPHTGSIKRAARHIIANPVRAGLVTQAGDYPLWDAYWL